MIGTNNAKTSAVLLAVAVALLVALAGPALAAAKFLPARYYPTGPFPVSAASADFNGDGRDDLAVSRFATHVLRSTGGGAFSAPVEYNASGSYDSVAGDFDADGDADVANVDGNNFGSVSVLPNNGSGAFGTIQRFESRGNPQGVATGDFDGDRDADLAAANAAGGYPRRPALGRPAAGGHEDHPGRQEGRPDGQRDGGLQHPDGRGLRRGRGRPPAGQEGDGRAAGGHRLLRPGEGEGHARPERQAKGRPDLHRHRQGRPGGGEGPARQADGGEQVLVVHRQEVAGTRRAGNV